MRLSHLRAVLPWALRAIWRRRTLASTSAAPSRRSSGTFPSARWLFRKQPPPSEPPWEVVRDGAGWIVGVWRGLTSEELMERASNGAPRAKRFLDRQDPFDDEQ